MDEQVTVNDEEKDTVKTTKCLNCGTEFEGNFCPECGQSADTKRFTIRFIFENLLKAILSNDGGVWITLKSMFIRPGQMMIDIINGKRKSYFSPFPMLFLTLSLYVIIFSFTGSKKEKFENMMIDDPLEITIDSVNVDSVTIDSNANTKLNVANKAKHYVALSLKFYQNNYAICFILTIPIYILAARLSFGRKNRKRYNWGEYCIPMVYSLVLLVLYRCLMSIVFYFSPMMADKMDDFMFVINIVVFTACFKKMMGFKTLKTMWRSFLVLCFYWILIISIISILAIIGIFIVYYATV